MTQAVYQASALAALPIAGALLFRIRGGWLQLPSTTLGRVAWSAPMAALAALASADWWLLGLGPLLFLGCVLPWWQTIDLARNEGRFWRDFIVMTGRGVLWVAPAFPLLFWREGWASLFVLAAGLSCAALYELGWRTPSNVRAFARGSELGEAYFGAAIGAGLAVAAIRAAEAAP